MADLPQATIGVLALQGGFLEHLILLRRAAARLATDAERRRNFSFIEVRTPAELERCDALVIPGGESTAISLVATQSGLMEPLRNFVKVDRKPTWGTCAGMILLADEANATKKGGQELIGGLRVRVHRNHFGRQVESFIADLDLPFLVAETTAAATQNAPYPGIFIRAPIVEEVLAEKEDTRSEVEVLAVLPGRRRAAGGATQVGSANEADEAGDIVSVKQGNVFGTSFHPELTNDDRIHAWWLTQVAKTLDITDAQ